MSDNHTDERDRELEALLQATFAGEARNRVPDSRAVPPFPETGRLATVHPIRRPWTGITLLAAALIAVLVGAFVVGDQVMNSKHEPAPAATTAPPEPTTTPTAPTTHATTPTPGTTSGTSNPSTPPAVTTKQVSFQGLTLTVPKAWNLLASPDDVPNPGACLTPDTDVHQTATEADNCELSVTVGGSAFNDDDDPDSPGFTPDGGICGTDGRTPNETTTVSSDEVVVDGESAEHRVFTGFCLSHDIDQWTVVTAPFVQFTRRVATSDPAGEAAARAVVTSAKLPGPRSALRLFDHGWITGMSGTTLSLDRIVVLRGGGTQNNNPATYDYPVTADTDIRFQAPSDDPEVTLTAAQLRTLAGGGTVSGVPAVGSLVAVLTTDGTSVTTVRLTVRQ